MAETSTSTGTGTGNFDNESPLVNLSPDHLFTILLRLPVDSILSFAMTCNRLRSLASSDALWESICRRDWGNNPVDDFKFSYSSSSSRRKFQNLPWMKLYKSVSGLESVYCRKLSDPDGDFVFPNPRASHSLNFVSDCLVLYGGGCEGGRHLDDTWVAYIGKDFRRMLKWQKVESGIPSGRFGHTCVVIENHLVLFGGINDRGDRRNDTWVAQVAWNDLGRVTLSWRVLDVGPIAPPSRGAHAACCIDNRKMVIHGGIGLQGLRLGDMWVLEISEDFCFGSWHEVVAHHPSPPPRSGHSLTFIRDLNCTILFGGRGSGYEVLSDVWLLDSSEGFLKWVHILYELDNIPEWASLARVGHSATLILGGRILIYGGEDSYRHRKDDFWLLDTKVIIQCCKTGQAMWNSKGILPKMWKRVKAEGYRPNCRSFHRACADYPGRILYVFGGMVDGLLQPADPSGLRFDGELLLVDLIPNL